MRLREREADVYCEEMSGLVLEFSNTNPRLFYRNEQSIAIRMRVSDNVVEVVGHLGSTDVDKLLDRSIHTRRYVDTRWSIPRASRSLCENIVDVSIVEDPDGIALDLGYTVLNLLNSMRGVLSFMFRNAKIRIAVERRYRAYGNTYGDRVEEMLTRLRISIRSPLFKLDIGASTLSALPLSYFENVLSFLETMCRAIYVSRSSSESAYRSIVIPPHVLDKILRTFIASHLLAESIHRIELGGYATGSDLSIVIDGGAPGMFYSKSFDDEGIATKRVVLVDRGRVVFHLSTSYTAIPLGLELAGCSSRYRNFPDVEPFPPNIVIPPGDLDINDVPTPLLYVLDARATDTDRVELVGLLIDGRSHVEISRTEVDAVKLLRCAKPCRTPISTGYIVAPYIGVDIECLRGLSG